MKYRELGARVVLFVQPSGSRSEVFWNYVEQIQFVPSEKVVARWSKPFPIIDGWICPRESRRRAGAGSGTPYKEIDPVSLIEIPDFYPDKAS
jgi:hypothetical protein